MMAAEIQTACAAYPRVLALPARGILATRYSEDQPAPESHRLVENRLDRLYSLHVSNLSSFKDGVGGPTHWT
jgi:hypothetical protein